MTSKRQLGNDIIITKVRDVKTPTRGTKESAGLDFYLPVIDKKMYKDLREKNPDTPFQINYPNELNDNVAQLVIPAGYRVLIPSGIKVGLPMGTMLMAANKSGVATKKGCLFTAEIVDSDYTGEIHLGIINLSKKEQIFEEGDKVVQFIHMPILSSGISEVTLDEYSEYTSQIDSNRGEGGFGSTGNK